MTETRATENGLGTEQGLGLGGTPRPEGRKGMSIIAHPLREQPLPLLPSARAWPSTYYVTYDTYYVTLHTYATYYVTYVT